MSKLKCFGPVGLEAGKAGHLQGKTWGWRDWKRAGRGGRGGKGREGVGREEKRREGVRQGEPCIYQGKADRRSGEGGGG